MSYFYGVDVIRAFEVSWLNSAGKPEIALLEIFQDPNRPNLDVWKLKAFLETLNDKSFAEFKTLRSEIFNFLKQDENFGDSYLKLISQQDFYNIDFFKMNPPAELPNKITQGLRFICEMTGQPQVGTASIYLASQSGVVREELTATLLEL